MDKELIGILVECSGMMDGFEWCNLYFHLNRLIKEVGKEKVVLVTFGGFGKVVADKELRSDIEYHQCNQACGTGRNFIEGFKTLEEALKAQGVANKELKIVVVSPGGAYFDPQEMKQKLKGAWITPFAIIPVFLQVGNVHEAKGVNQLGAHYRCDSGTPAHFHISDSTNRQMYEERIKQLTSYLK